jgi:hypothetical protein
MKIGARDYIFDLKCKKFAFRGGKTISALIGKACYYEAMVIKRV